MNTVKIIKQEPDCHRLINRLAQQIKAEADVRCLINEPMEKHTSFCVGGPAALYIYPTSVQDLTIVLQFCREHQLEKFLIGCGTNLLVSDDGFDGCVIDLAEVSICCGMNINGDVLTVGSAVCLNEAVRYSAEHGLGGWSKLAGIPGGIGGGLRMNAGAFRSYISDYVVDVDVMDWNGNIRTMMKDEIGFTYRNAADLADRIVLSARFQLPFIGRNKAVETVEATIVERFCRNVMLLPSAGSVFKNPHGEFAARLIESVGGKGIKVGGVEVSTHHANFIVNNDGGNAADIIRLIEKIREMVYDRYRIRLELEIRTLGF